MRGFPRLFRRLAPERAAHHMAVMVYRIRYYDADAKEIGSAPWAESLEQTKRVAQDGIIRHRAASARIFDEDQNNRKVWPRP